ncbi:MAG: UDP-N-acetylmuramoyl-L-alanine--D-glutamate ligase, partial [Gammaproteobacteria bacterium]|nr:UDP-N-acetylmuramoyl-L-alanine--D-glutamate ligase [Gammaproteobacteria bacterium]
ENMLAAVLTVLLAGGNAEAIQDGLESFRGLPHRLEFVAEIEGVRFYDDSKGTNIGAA